MDLTKRLDWEDEEEETAVERHRPVGNLHMFAGTHGPAQDFPIYPGSNVIGHHSSCNITLPSQSVSKKHAVLCVTGDCHTIYDNGSLNKTRRNKVALEPYLPYSLSNGEFLLFADVACRYSILKKIEVETTIAEESEYDSLLVPGTPRPLTFEKTSDAAIRLMVHGAVLARDSDEEVRRGWSDGGEGGSKDALRTSRPAAGALFPPDFVPESDEENMSSSGMLFTSVHLPCDSDTDNRGTPTKESSIPSSMDRFTPAAVKEPAKEESSRLFQTNKVEKPVGEQTDEEKEFSSAGRDVVLDSGLLEERKETSKDGADDRLPFVGGMVVQKDTLDSALKDGGTKAINHNNSHEDKNLMNNAAKVETSEVSSTSSHCLKVNDDETSSRDIDGNSDAGVHMDRDASVEVEKETKDGIHMDSDIDVEEDVNVSSTDVTKEKQTLNIDFQEGFHVDSDTDVEDVDVSSTVVTKEKQDPSNSVEDAREGLPLDSDTDVDEEDQGPGLSSAAVQSRTESRIDELNFEMVKNNKEAVGVTNKGAEDLHFDSDTDDGTSTGLKAGGSVKTDAEKNEAEAANEADALHMDSDTDVDENDASMRLNESQTAEVALHSKGVLEGDGNLDKVAASVGVIGEVPKADTSTGSVKSNEEEAPKADSQDIFTFCDKSHTPVMKK